MFPRRSTRIRAAAVLAAVLALVLASPVGAAGWTGWRGVELGDGLVHRVLVWLGVAPAAPVKCDLGSHIDPDGCPKLGSQVDPDGASATGGTGEGGSDLGSHIDPNGQP